MTSFVINLFEIWKSLQRNLVRFCNFLIVEVYVQQWITSGTEF